MRNVFGFGAACLAALLVACGGGEDADPGHYVSGTLSGLAAGNSVTVRDVSGESVVLSADGSYTFGRFPKGTAYEISVTSAEPNQICSVANGTGQIGGQDISNVQASCATAYGIGGTVSGYPGTGLSLSLNGTQTLPITANGPFEFGAFLLPQSAYAVTIASQPAGHECAVAQGSGTMPAARVSDVAVSCRPSTGRLAYTVTGVRGSDGLSLRLTGSGADETRTVFGNASGQFDSLLNTGRTYQVDLLESPSRYSCALAQASGTFDAQAPGTVRVNCSFAGYRVGGIIELFAGETATLTLYDGFEAILDTVTVSAPSSGSSDRIEVPFTFGVGLDNGQAFMVYVSTPPPPDQMCSSGNRNNSGTIDNADVTDLSFYCFAP